MMTMDEIADQLIDEWDKTFLGRGGDGPEFYHGVAVGIRFAVKRVLETQASSD